MAWSIVILKYFSMLTQNSNLTECFIVLVTSGNPNIGTKLLENTWLEYQVF